MFLSAISLCVLAFIIKVESYKNHVLVIGGRFVTIEEFPHSAHLVVRCYKKTISCGASILNQLILLTAGHCFDICGVDSKFTHGTGDENATVTVKSAHKKQGTVYKVVKIKIHEQYDERNLTNDIALLKVDKHIQFSNEVGRVMLAQHWPNDTEGEVAGWGLVNMNNQNTDYIKSTKLEIISHDECKQQMFEHWPQRATGLFCARGGSNQQIKNNSTEYGRTNRGDSGSAMVVRGFIQVGVFSHFYDNPSYMTHGITLYTNVSYFYDWIVIESRALYCRA